MKVALGKGRSLVVVMGDGMFNSTLHPQRMNDDVRDVEVPTAQRIDTKQLTVGTEEKRQLGERLKRKMYPLFHSNRPTFAIIHHE